MHMVTGIGDRDPYRAPGAGITVAERLNPRTRRRGGHGGRRQHGASASAPQPRSIRIDGQMGKC
ncbi:hypothetical protein AB4212_13260, partial [Streptomyces sp. 2MCAF27]